ncbi:proteasome subunit beta type-6-like [Pollicipes pollicipes]|uniref:proteasome subunit beta type-6-like n=1 Tax=Pollicipes pollicipes TaxID=41117 RepID=UPI001884BA8F|nr:proteasome subunit beta type-6-like [Pollicipes pollicipes]XP_037068250.1 proteasome subunit beta type-6-like [Pollicipes pollicipes]
MMQTATSYAAPLPEWLSAEHDMGTTLVAAEFPGGVVIGADSRTSTGTYVANRVSNKITRITDSVYCCRSGSAADTQALADIVSYRMAMHEIEMGQPALVKTVSNTFREMCYQYRDDLMAGILCAGYDRVNGGQIYSIPIGGMMVRQKVASGGSGSTYIYGFLDSNYRPDFSQEDCVDFIRRAVSLAIHRDGSSGGVCRVAIITANGVERRTFTGRQLFVPQ